VELKHQQLGFSSHSPRNRNQKTSEHARQKKETLSLMHIHYSSLITHPLVVVVVRRWKLSMRCILDKTPTTDHFTKIQRETTEKLRRSEWYCVDNSVTPSIEMRVEKHNKIHPRKT
jgi:hypothetical protein